IVAGDNRQPPAHAGSGNSRRITPASRERPSLAEAFDVELQRFLGVSDRLLEGLTLRVQAREVGGVHLVPALLLGVASAVAEGAMAVLLLHQYLALLDAPS